MHLAGLETFESLLRSEIPKKATHWSAEQLSAQVTQTYPSRLSVTRQLFALLPRESRILSQGINALQWKSEIRSWNHTQTVSSFSQDPHPASNRISLLWGPFAWRAFWIFKNYRRLDLSLLAQFLLDHWRSRSYLHRIRKHESPLCRLCGQSEETRQHILQCPHIWHLRSQHLPGIQTLEALSVFLQKRPNICSLTKFLCALHHLWKNQE